MRGLGRSSVHVSIGNTGNIGNTGYIGNAAYRCYKSIYCLP